MVFNQFILHHVGKSPDDTSEKFTDVPKCQRL